MKTDILILGLVLLIFGFSLDVYADRRSYVWTYEYMTMPEGMAEVEYYLTTVVPDMSQSNVHTWKHWVELEYGLTNRWDVAIYQQFKQSNKSGESDFEYAGFKLRTRYRFGEKGRYLLDPLIYLEYIRDDDFSAPHILEGKLILAKDVDRFNFSYNQILKQELESDGQTEQEFAFGANYQLSSLFKFGLESKGNYTKEKYYLGPTISLAAKKFWLSFGVVLGLNNKSDDVQARMIFGIPF